MEDIGDAERDPEGCVLPSFPDQPDSEEAPPGDEGDLLYLVGHGFFSEPTSVVNVFSFDDPLRTAGPALAGLRLFLRLGEVAPGPRPLGDRPVGVACGPHPRGRGAPATIARMGGVAGCR